MPRCLPSPERSNAESKYKSPKDKLTHWPKFVRLRPHIRSADFSRETIFFSVASENRSRTPLEIVLYRGVRIGRIFIMCPFVPTGEQEKRSEMSECLCRECGSDERLLEARRNDRRIGGRACRISRLADATALHQHVILAGQGHWTEGDHQKQVWYVGLRALAVDHVAFLRSEITTDERILSGSFTEEQSCIYELCLRERYRCASARLNIADITCSIIRCL